MSADRIYAIGDVHGQLDLLLAAHALIERDQSEYGPAPVIHVGDLVDRGPNSAGVISHIIDGIEAGRDWVVLKGNHDRMMAWYLQDPSRHDHCLSSSMDWQHPALGGWETLQSYGVDMSLDGDDLHQDARSKVPAKHREFLGNLPTMWRGGEVAVVHAGIRPGVALDQQDEDDLVWIRNSFHVSRADHGALIIHGHTPVETIMHCGNRVNIDTGAAYGGPLSTIVVEGRQVWHLTPRGRREVLPPRRA